MTSTAFLDQFLSDQPSSPAVVTASVTRTYSELAKRVFSLARGLQELGLPQGSSVALMLPSGLNSIEATLAILRAGFVHVAVNAVFKSKETLQVLSDSDARAIIVAGDKASLIEEIRDGLPLLQKVIVVGDGPGELGFDELASARTDAVPLPAADSAAALTYTGGTTGSPKGALHDQWNIARQCDALVEYFELTPDDRVLGALPTFLFPPLLMGHFNALRAGAALHLMERFDAAEALRLLIDEQITVMTGSKTMCWMLNELPSSANEDLGFMRALAFGGMYQPLEVRDAFERRFNRPTLHVYGMTEGPNVVAGTRLHLDEETRRRTRESVGHPLAGIEIAAFDEQDQRCAPGNSGEICLRPDGSRRWKPMVGYYKRQTETEHAMRNGWYHSGDAGYVDGDGFVFVFGRTQDLIKVSGWSVFPAEIETVIVADPRVQEVAVVAVPDPKSGERPVAYITLRENATATSEEFERLVAGELASFKRLRAARIVQDLPKNVYGKVQKKQLRESWISGQAEALDREEIETT
jgi:long-chain acyl-CoA synthetase